MKKLTMIAAVVLMSAGAAYAEDTTVIHRDGPMGSSTTVRHDDMVTGSTVEKRTTTSDDEGCTTKSVTKSNDMGDKVTKTKSDC
jgi:hypothetical protein